jgi:uncharacterized protein involved in exopolysaccharide biosynthesis
MVIEPTTRDLIAVIFRRKRALLLTFFLVMAAGAAYLLTAHTLYRSDAQVVVRFGDNVVPDLSRNVQPVQLVPDERRNIVLANVDILKSHDLLVRALQNFGLDKIYPEIAAKFSNPEQAMEEAVHQLESDLLVDPGEKGNVISISLLNHDRHLVQGMVQYVIDEYSRRQAALYSDPQIGFQKGEVDKARATLARAQSDLEQFKRQDNIVDFDTEVQSLLKQRSEMAQTLNATQAKLTEAEQRRIALEAQLRQIPPMIAGPASGEHYRGSDDALTRLSDLKLKESQLLATYKPDSPVVQQLHHSVQAAESEYRRAVTSSDSRATPAPNPVYQTLQTDYMHAIGDSKANGDAVRVVQSGVDAIDKRLDDLNHRHEGLVERQRAVQIAEDTYRALSAHLNDSQVTNALNSQNIFRATVLSPPTLPFKPAHPRVFLTIAGTLIVATILSLIVAFVLELMDSRFRTPMQVVTVLDLPVLAAIGETKRHPDYLRLT